MICGDLHTVTLSELQMRSNSSACGESVDAVHTRPPGPVARKARSGLTIGSRESSERRAPTWSAKRQPNGTDGRRQRDNGNEWFRDASAWPLVQAGFGGQDVLRNTGRVDGRVSTTDAVVQKVGGRRSGGAEGSGDDDEGRVLGSDGF